VRLARLTGAADKRPASKITSCNKVIRSIWLSSRCSFSYSRTADTASSFSADSNSTLQNDKKKEKFMLFAIMTKASCGVSPELYSTLHIYMQPQDAKEIAYAEGTKVSLEEVLICLLILLQ